MKIEVLFFDGCPNHKLAVERVRQVVAEEGISAEILEVNVSDPSVPQNLEFLGSPSIRVNGLDVEPEARMARAHGMMCRTYVVNGRREGLPSHEMLRQAMREENSGWMWCGRADARRRVRRASCWCAPLARRS